MYAIWIFLKTILYALLLVGRIIAIYLILLALAFGIAYLVEKITGYPILNEEEKNGSKSGETN